MTDEKPRPLKGGVFCCRQKCFNTRMNESPPSPTNPTAAVLVIGNEILSGRTQDSNLHYIAQKLTSIGIRLSEARVIPDVEVEIVAAVNALRSKYTYVFTTGGIGPTHDDITVDAIAAAFGVPVIEHPEARARLEKHYTAEHLTPARLRMARVPANATLIDNPISSAPGIKVENVYVMAGVPKIMQGMIDGIAATLQHGAQIHSVSVSGYVAESVVARELGMIAADFPQLDIGSYPWMRGARFGTALVTRGTDKTAVDAAVAQILKLMQSHDRDSLVEATPTAG
jgi:molybdenum cofactor synthesis domain-containing protein